MRFIRPLFLLCEEGFSKKGLVSLDMVLRRLTDNVMISMRVFMIALLFSLPLKLLVYFNEVSGGPTVHKVISTCVSIVHKAPLVLRLVIICFKPCFVFKVHVSVKCDLVTIFVTFDVGCTTCFTRVCEKKVRSVSTKRCRTTGVLKCDGTRAFFEVVLPRIVGEVLPSIAGRIVALMGSASLTFIITISRVFAVTGRVTDTRAAVVPFIVTTIFCFIFGLLITVMVSGVRGGLGCCH